MGIKSPKSPIKRKAGPKRSKGGQRLDETTAEEKAFLNFFKMDLKSDEEIKQMSVQKRKQYICRLKRWDSLIETHVMYECYKALAMFGDIDRKIAQTFARIQEIRSSAELMAKYNDKQLMKVETETQEIQKQLKTDRDVFDDIYIPFKANRKDAEIKAKNESEVEVKDEDFSDSDIKEEEDSDIEVKTEDDSDIEVKTEDDSDIEVKTEDDSDIEVKTEDDSDIEVKEEDDSDVEIKEEEDSDISVKKEDETEEEDDSDIEIKEELDSSEAEIKDQSDSDIDMKPEYEEINIKEEVNEDVKDVKPVIKQEIKSEIKEEIKTEMKMEVKEEESD